MKRSQLHSLLKECGLTGNGYVLEPLPDPITFSKEYREKGKKRPSEDERRSTKRRVLHDESGVVVAEFPNESEALDFINESLNDYNEAVSEAVEIFEEALAESEGDIDMLALSKEATNHIRELFPSLNSKEIMNAIERATDLVFPDEETEDKKGIKFGSGKITMTKKQFLKEHRNLLKVLKEAKPKELKKEYEEQKKEMSKYVGKGLKGGAYRPVQIEIQVPQDVWVIVNSRTNEQYKEGDNIPIFDTRWDAEGYIERIMSGEIEREQEEMYRSSTPTQAPKSAFREPPPAPKRGRGLSKDEKASYIDRLSEEVESGDLDESAWELFDEVRGKLLADHPDNQDLQMPELSEFRKKAKGAQRKTLLRSALNTLLRVLEMKGGSQTHRKRFLKKHKLPLNTALSIEEISSLSGFPVKTLQEVYNRGVGAYKTNPESVRVKGTFKKDPKAPLSKKLSKEQWGMARLYSFVDGNKKHDADLR
jgi:hypothetical protein